MASLADTLYVDDACRVLNSRYQALVTWKQSSAADRAELVAALSRVTAGDRTALHQVYLSTSPKLFGICLRISQDREAAKDILQDVYLKIWNRAGRFDSSRSSPITWLCAIARNAAIDWRRAQVRPLHVSQDHAANIADDSVTAEQALGDAQERARVVDCLDGLDINHRRAIRSAFFDGFTYGELADRLKVPLGTMKSWIRRGLLQLRECLGDG